MEYQNSLLHLKRVFSENDFNGHLSNRRQHAAYVDVETCSNGSKISISFPGYKATSRKPDYRVDLTKNGLTTALSHANIIVDLYNKCKYGGMSHTELKSVLVEQVGEGRADLTALQIRLPYSPVDPSEDLKNEAYTAHGGKKYNRVGNRFDLTLEELFTSMKWIVLQEDVNYPMPRYLGRKMPFSRYVETLHVASGEGHSLQEVIQRALMHVQVPPLWTDVDYSFLQRIN